MGHDGAPPRGFQPGGYDVFVRVSRDAREPVEAPADPFEMARIGVMHEAPTAVADRTRLRRGEVAGLGGGDFVESLESVRWRRCGGHDVPANIHPMYLKWDIVAETAKLHRW